MHSHFVIVAVLGTLVAVEAASRISVKTANYDSGPFGSAIPPLLMEYHDYTTDDMLQRFAFPARNTQDRVDCAVLITDVAEDSSVANLGSCARVGLSETHVTGMAMNDGFSVWLFASGYADSLDFDLDARLNWIHSSGDFSELDGESVHEIWDDGDNWINYTRYRGHLGYNYAWVRLELGHDAMHWGPGYYSNLTLNRQAIPYNYFSIDLIFGPLRVLSFYSKLKVDSANVYTHQDDYRNFYGHRYEIALGNLTVGMSEIQLIYNNNNPWLLAPIYPLFIEKGNYEEGQNNGAIALDLNYRLFRVARIYGEFFLDDMDSPISVIKNEYLDSEWAWMLGLQVAHDIAAGVNKVQLGSVFEIARIEQLVYSHYDSYQGQFANAGRVLGNPNGPNSLGIDWLVYSRFSRGLHMLYASLRNSWIWKGDVYGSDFNQSIVPGVSPKMHKNYLGGAKMHYRITPSLAYEKMHWGISAEVGFGYNAEKNAKAWVRW